MSADRPLRIARCERVCDWATSDDVVDGAAVFQCTQCGTEWTHQQRWTPARYDGTVPPAVAAERHNHPNR